MALILTACTDNSAVKIDELSQAVVDKDEVISELQDELESQNESIRKLSEEVLNYETLLDETLKEKDSELEELEGQIEKLHSEMELVKSTFLESSRYYSILSINEGDEVNGLVVKELIGESLVVFDGQIELTGKISIDYFENYDAELITMSPNDESVTRLPKSFGDTRKDWFVFENHDEAMVLLENKNLEDLTVVIESYTVDDAPACVYNTAKLVQLVSD